VRELKTCSEQYGISPVAFRQGYQPNPLVYPQKVKLVNMKDSLAGKLRHLMSIYHLERRVAANIKRLQKM
jgi:hypothetical protein